MSERCLSGKHNDKDAATCSVEGGVCYKDANLLVCEECGGTNIQCLDWVDANTSECKGTLENLTTNERWCDDCESHTGFITKAKYERSVEDAKLIS